MDSDNAKFAIGFAYDDHSQTQAAIRELTGAEPDTFRVPQLAGPNDLIQFLANIHGWKDMLQLVVEIVGIGAGEEAGRAAFKALAPRIAAAPAAVRDRLLRITDALRSEKTKKRDVSIGLIEPVFDSFARKDRIYLDDLTPEELARHFYVFGNCAGQVSAWLSAEHDKLTEPGQMFVEMKVTDDSKLVVTLVAGGPTTPLRPGVFRKVFDAHGNLIDEESA